MGLVWFWVLIGLFILFLLALPSWPYSRGRWGFGYSGAALLILLIIIALVWWGWFSLWWPWGAGWRGYYY